MNVRDLLARLAEARRALLASLDGLSEADLTHGEVTAGFTAKDVLAHVAARDREVLAALEAFFYDSRPYRVAMPSVDAWNAQMRDARRGLPLPQVMMDLHMARAEIENLVAQCHPEILAEELEYPWQERGPLGQLVEAYCVAHDAHHAADLRAWRARAGLAER